RDPSPARGKVRRFADQPRDRARRAAHHGGAHGAARHRRRGRAHLFRPVSGCGRRLRHLPAELRNAGAVAARRRPRMSLAKIPVWRITAAWVAAVVMLVPGTIAFAIFGGGGRPDTVGPPAFSRSAIGYAGMADVMHRLGTRVLKSR